MIMNVLKNYKFSILVAIAIFYFCVRSTVPDFFYLSENNRILCETETNPITLLSLRDFFGHMFAYVLLTICLCLETNRREDAGTLSRSKIIFVCVILPIVYGGVMELVQQYFFPPRSAEWMDLLADTIGVFFAAGLIYVLMKKIKLNTNVTIF